jgi:hypothetical protein
VEIEKGNSGNQKECEHAFRDGIHATASAAPFSNNPTNSSSAQTWSLIRASIAGVMR